MVAGLETCVRPITPGEIEVLGELARRTYADAFGAAMSASDLAYHLAHRLSDGYFRQAFELDVILAADLERRLVGFIQFGKAEPIAPERTPADREIRRLYVIAECQNRGIGRRLMDAALTHRSLARAQSIYLDVWEDNHAAQRFYRRFGFETVGAHTIELASGASQGRDLVMVRRKGHE